jgi:hypothetical protein
MIAARFVWGVWGLLVTGLLALITIYAVRIPYHEDWWLFVSRLTGNESVDFDWLWRAGEEGAVPEHREPLWKLLMISLLKLSGGDFRVPMYFSILVLGGLAFAMIWTAKRLRGSIAWADAFLPLILLQFNSSVFDASVATVYLSATVQSGIILLIMLRFGTLLPLRPGLLAGLCLNMLPLSGPYGMVYLPALGLWYAGCVVHSWVSGERARKRHALLFAALGCSALVLARLYMHGLYLPPHENQLTPEDRADALLAVWAASFGQASLLSWPLSKWVIAGLVALAIGTLILQVWQRPGIERCRALSLLAFLAAGCTLAWLLVRGRVSSPEDFSTAWNYYIFPVPMACGIYFVWVVYRPRVVGYLVPVGLFALACLATVPNFIQMMDHCRGDLAELRQLEKDLQSGVPLYQLLGRYHDPLLTTLPEPREMEYFRMLHNAGIRPFRHLQDNPPFRKLALSEIPTEVTEITWKKRMAVGGPNSILSYALPKPLFVAAVQIECTYGDTVPVSPVVYWKDSEKPQFAAFGAEHLQFFCVGETIDAIRIYPSQDPFTFQITKLTLLLPETGESHAAARPVFQEVQRDDG